MNSLSLWVALAALMIAVSHCQNVDFGFGRDNNRDRQLELERQREQERQREERERQRAREIFAGCREKVADIFFILDSSNSIYIEDYFKQQQFIRSMVNRLEIDSRYTRVGALTFSDNYRLSFDLDQYRDKSSLVNAMNNQNIPYLSGLTNTASAIRYVRENVQFRNDITRAIVVLTDGYSANPASTAAEADLARREGNYMFVIGVGQYTDEREWRAIASDPDDNFMFNISDYRALERLQSTIAQRICSLPPLIISRVQNCYVRRSADLYFVASSSASEAALPIITTITENMQYTPRNGKMSLLVSSCEEGINVPIANPNDFCGPSNPPSQDNFLALLRRATDSAAEDRGLSSGFGGGQVVVLFIDDNAMYDAYEISQLTRSAIRDGMTVYIVDLGVTDNRNFLDRMASGRDGVFSVNDRSVGGSLEGRLLMKICDEVNRQPFIPDLPPPTK